MVVPSRDEGGSSSSKGQGGQGKRRIARDGVGHCKSKSVQNGVGQEVGKRGIPPDLCHIYPTSAASFALFLRARRCGAGRVICGAGLPSLVSSLILPTPPTLSLCMDTWTAG